MSHVSRDGAEIDAAAAEAWLINASREIGLSIASDEDFFDAGGNSLSIIRLIAKADARFGGDVLTPDEFVEPTTVCEIAARLARKLGSAKERAAEHET